jgi:hypothetical protein
MVHNGFGCIELDVQRVAYFDTNPDLFFNVEKNNKESSAIFELINNFVKEFLVSKRLQIIFGVTKYK